MWESVKVLHSNGDDKTNCNTDHVESNSNHYRRTVNSCQASNGINIPHLVVRWYKMALESAHVSSTSAIWRPYLGCRNRLSWLLSTSFRLSFGVACKKSICIIFSCIHTLQFSYVNHILSRSVCAIKTSVALLESAVPFKECNKSEQELKLRYFSFSLSIVK